MRHKYEGYLDTEERERAKKKIKNGAFLEILESIGAARRKEEGTAASEQQRKKEERRSESLMEQLTHSIHDSRTKQHF